MKFSSCKIEEHVSMDIWTKAILDNNVCTSVNMHFASEYICASMFVRVSAHMELVYTGLRLRHHHMDFKAYILI